MTRVSVITVLGHVCLYSYLSYLSPAANGYICISGMAEPSKLLAGRCADLVVAYMLRSIASKPTPEIQTDRQTDRQTHVDSDRYKREIAKQHPS